MLYGGPTHLKGIAEWEMETKANVFGVVPDIIPDPGTRECDGTETDVPATSTVLPL